MTGDIADTEPPTTSDGRLAAGDRTAVEVLLARAGLPASEDEVDELTRAYRSIRVPVEALYSEHVAALL